MKNIEISVIKLGALLKEEALTQEIVKEFKELIFEYAIIVVLGKKSYQSINKILKCPREDI